MSNPLAAYNWLDLTIFLLLLTALAVGFAQGILRQVIGLAAFYIAIILGAQYYYPLSEFVRGVLFVRTNALLESIVFLVIVIAVWMLLTWLAFDAYRSTKIHFAPLLDQLGGSVVALATIVAALALIAPVINFMVSEPWTGAENAHQVFSSAMRTSVLVKQLLVMKVQLISAIEPWMPYGIPSIFNF
jgi:membrane protein required for colicin V production